MQKSRNLKRISYSDAVFYSLMVGSGETFIVAFALANGVSEGLAAAVSIVPLGIASVLQLWSLKLSRLVADPKKWVVGCVAMQGLSLLALGSTPFFEGLTLNLMFVAATLYWFFGLSAGPSWNLWLGNLVPLDQQRKFFSQRNFYLQGAALFSMLASGCVLNWFSRDAEKVIPTFIGLFVFAAIARCTSALFLSMHPPDHKYQQTKRARLIQKPKEGFSIVHGFLLTFSMSFAVYISSPYFSPYMLKELKLDYFEYGSLLAIVYIARMGHSYVQTTLMRNVPSRNIFVSGMIMIVPLPVLWSYSSDYAYLAFLQAWSGFAWGSYELGLTLYLMEHIEGSRRYTMLTWFNMSSAMGMLLGMFLGLYIMGTVNPGKSQYDDVFGISSIMRLLPLMFVAPFMRSIKEHAVQFSAVGIRAGGRSIVTPVFLPPESSDIRDQHDNVPHASSDSKDLQTLKIP